MKFPQVGFREIKSVKDKKERLCALFYINIL